MTVPHYKDFAPDSARFVWEGRPEVSTYLALKQNEGRIIVSLPHPDTGEEVRALVLYVEVPEQPPMPALDEVTSSEIVANTVPMLCGKELDTARESQHVALACPHIRIHCNRVVTEAEPSSWLMPWV